ncbi:MAG: alpha-amylase [Actinobacteria bacterium]|nr:alpha-amylase [Actinomycetota bacterium]
MPDVRSGVGEEPGDRPSAWWHGTVGYEIYIRSFQDSDGDGVGDLEGIRRRLPYLAELGIDLVWITPFYPSPQADHGYDVADYVDVDPTFGDLADLDRVVSDCHDLGMRLVIDLVPNHSSSEHPWFRAALAGDPHYRDHYVWADPAPDGGPPNNWVSNFGGPAWTLDERSGQYYMHLFLPEQPDLNWANPAVHDEFDRILRFWFERGVDGVRIDVAHSLTEDPQLRDNPRRAALPPAGAAPSEVWDAYEHRFDQDQADVLDVFRRWNALAAEHDAFLVGEVYLLEPDLLTRYVADQDGLHSSFAFPALRTAWDAGDIRTTLGACVTAGAGALSWPLSSHDDPHAASRFGGGDRGRRRQLAYLTLLCALPGIPFLFQGDELGLENGVVAAGHAADPMAVRNPGAAGRDGSRTPMVWEPGPGFGFTTGEPWLPFGSNRRDEDTVAAQLQQPDSHLDRTRRLLALRRELAPCWDDGASVTWLEATEDVVALQRGDTLVALNAGETAARVRLPDAGRWHPRYASSGGIPEVADGAVVVAPDAAVLLVTASPSAS